MVPAQPSDKEGKWRKCKCNNGENATARCIDDNENVWLGKMDSGVAAEMDGAYTAYGLRKTAETNSIWMYKDRSEGDMLMNAPEASKWRELTKYVWDKKYW